MIKKFYVDINELEIYSKDLKKNVSEIQQSVSFILKENQKYQLSLQDNISNQVNMHIKNLEKIFNNFSNEIDSLSRQIKKDYELYMTYSKKINMWGKTYG